MRAAASVGMPDFSPKIVDGWYITQTPDHTSTGEIFVPQILCPRLPALSMHNFFLLHLRLVMQKLQAQVFLYHHCQISAELPQGDASPANCNDLVASYCTF